MHFPRFICFTGFNNDVRYILVDEIPKHLSNHSRRGKPFPLNSPMCSSVLNTPSMSHLTNICWLKRRLTLIMDMSCSFHKLYCGTKMNVIQLMLNNTYRQAAVNESFTHFILSKHLKQSLTHSGDLCALPSTSFYLLGCAHWLGETMV